MKPTSNELTSFGPTERETHQELQSIPDESVNYVAAMVTNRTATSMAMVPLAVPLSTPGVPLLSHGMSSAKWHDRAVLSADASMNTPISA